MAMELPEWASLIHLEAGWRACIENSRQEKAAWTLAMIDPAVAWAKLAVVEGVVGWVASGLTCRCPEKVAKAFPERSEVGQADTAQKVVAARAYKMADKQDVLVVIPLQLALVVLAQILALATQMQQVPHRTFS